MADEVKIKKRYMELEQKPDQNWNSKDSENYAGDFDCNICLEFANEPIVTLCGHLYCWSCIYKWFHIQSASLESDEFPQCPVCKAKVTHTTVIPLYSRGQSNSQSQSAPRDMVIPPRPPACGTQALLNAVSQPSHPYRNPYQVPEEISSSSTSPLAGDVVQPVVGFLGEMVYARVFGNSYAYPNSYNAVQSNSSRVRRQEMQVDKSLSRVSLFLLCCFILCLFLF